VSGIRDPSVGIDRGHRAGDQREAGARVAAKELVFDRAVLLGPKNGGTVEYSWRISIDVFGDGQTGTGFWAENLKRAGDHEHVGAIPENVETGIGWNVPMPAVIGYLGAPELSVDGNALVFRFDTRADPGFLDVSAGSKITAETLFNDGKTTCSRSWPK
jgi:hypothetical protein